VARRGQAANERIFKGKEGGKTQSEVVDLSLIDFGSVGTLVIACRLVREISRVFIIVNSLQYVADRSEYVEIYDRSP
jgi:hypothetical protein